MSKSAVTYLKELVAIPSQNPMGRSDPGDGFGEAALTDHLETTFERLGCAHYRQPVHPDRANIFARLDGDRRGDRHGPVVLFEAHQDTVPVDGMTIDPWDPREEDGRIYGRGSCDVKGGMAAMLAVLERLRDRRPPHCPTVVMACSINEEHGFSGVEAMRPLLACHETDFVPAVPTLAVVAEPTGLQVVVAHKGAVRWCLHTRGHAAHSSMPEKGSNAIYRMAQVVDALNVYQRESLPTLGSHPLCGPATLSVGVIRGGLSVNTVPDSCTIEIDRRLMPNETPEQAQQHLLTYLEQTVGVDMLELETPFMTADPLSDAANGPLAQRLGESIRSIVGSWQAIGVPYATDAPYIARLGIPTVVFGPGSLEQAHTKDEWISVEQLESTADVLYDFICRLGE
ncbi:MAG: M20 family metallopeptidase [Planctomycetaceae bacterium]|nr:M20 family metallopeptidase [Planctomycetaceae bacterium]